MQLAPDPAPQDEHDPDALAGAVARIARLVLHAQALAERATDGPGRDERLARLLDAVVRGQRAIEALTSPGPPVRRVVVPAARSSLRPAGPAAPAP